MHSELTLWQSHILLLAVFHCIVLFIGYQWNLDYCSRSVCWPEKNLSWTQLGYLHAMLAASLPSSTLRSNKGISLSDPRVKTITGARAFHSCAQSLCNSLLLSLLSDNFSCYLQGTSEDTSLWLCLSPIDNSTQDIPLMLQNCFINIVVEHRIGCHAIEPDFAGNIGAIEMWLIDWLIDMGTD